jgi:hypothetical protein
MLKRMLIVMALSAGAARGAECPLDQVIFRDEPSKREFAAERVALNYVYLCGEKFVSASRERSALKQCRGPYGDTIIEGFLGGEKVYAVYTVIKGSPCCSWESYIGTNTEVLKRVKEWLPSGTGPRIELGSEWYTIADGPVEGRVHGPLGGATFVPVVCRKP